MTSVELDILEKRNAGLARHPGCACPGCQRSMDIAALVAEVRRLREAIDSDWMLLSRKKYEDVYAHICQVARAALAEPAKPGRAT